MKSKRSMYLREGTRKIVRRGIVRGVTIAAATGLFLFALMGGSDGTAFHIGAIGGFICLAWLVLFYIANFRDEPQQF